MKKKILSISIITILIAMLFILTGCGNSQIKDSQIQEQQQEQQEEQKALNTNSSDIENLGDCAKVGDYVNYMGSDTNFRILNISENSAGEKTIYLIYSSYLKDGYNAQGSYENLLAYLRRTDIYTNYLDTNYADEVLTTAGCGRYEKALKDYYKTVSDLFDVGEDVTLCGEVTINYYTKKIGFYENGSGEVTGTSGWNYYIRPEVKLKTDIKTNGKNEAGAWILDSTTSNNNKSSNQNTTPTDYDLEDETAQIASYMGEYEWKSGNDHIAFELLNRDGKYEYYMMYYKNGSTAPEEQLWGKWDTNNNIKLVNNENFESIASYKFEDIKYQGNSIEITIKYVELKEEKFKDYKIPDGTYKFTKK